MDPNIRNAKPMSYPVSQNSPNLSTKQPMIYNGRVGGNFTIPSNPLPPPVPQIHGVTHPGEFCSSLPMNDMVTIQKLSHKRKAPTSFPPIVENMKSNSSHSLDFSSSIDVVEYEKDYRLYMDLPIVSKDALQVLIQNEGIRIEGNRDINYKDSKRVLFKKRLSGHFIVFIPCNIKMFDISGAKAIYDNGELCILLNKRFPKKDEENDIKISKPSSSLSSINKVESKAVSSDKLDSSVSVSTVTGFSPSQLPSHSSKRFASSNTMSV